MLRETGAAVVDTSGDGWLCRAGAEPQPDDFELPAASRFERGCARAADVSVVRVVQRFAGEPAMRDAVERARAFAEGFDAVDPAIASVRAIADEWRSGVDSTSARPIGGYAPLLDRLRDALAAAGVRTQLSTPVRRIAWRRGNVTVDAVDDAGAEWAIGARAAVVTLPVGVLRAAGAVAFNPPLPPAKHAALQHIEMGAVVKVGLWFRTAFWEELRGGRYRDAGFFRCNAGSFPAYWTRVPVRTEQIAAWAGGTKATALHGLSESELIERALDGFGAALGEGALARREFVDGVMHDWDHDPYARGAYSYVAVGGGDARSALGAPVDDALFFAGEGDDRSTEQGGTVNWRARRPASGPRMKWSLPWRTRRPPMSGMSALLGVLGELLRDDRFVGRGTDRLDVRRDHPEVGRERVRQKPRRHFDFQHPDGAHASARCCSSRRSGARPGTGWLYAQRADRRRECLRDFPPHAGRCGRRGGSRPIVPMSRTGPGTPSCRSRRTLRCSVVRSCSTFDRSGEALFTAIAVGSYV